MARSVPRTWPYYQRLLLDYHWPILQEPDLAIGINMTTGTGFERIAEATAEDTPRIGTANRTKLENVDSLPETVVALIASIKFHFIPFYLHLKVTILCFEICK